MRCTNHASCLENQRTDALWRNGHLMIASLIHMFEWELCCRSILQSDLRRRLNSWLHDKPPAKQAKLFDFLSCYYVTLRLSKLPRYWVQLSALWHLTKL